MACLTAKTNQLESRKTSNHEAHLLGPTFFFFSFAFPLLITQLTGFNPFIYPSPSIHTLSLQSPNPSHSLPQKNRAKNKKTQKWHLKTPHYSLALPSSSSLS